MDLELTRIFIKVAQNSSFTRAAELLKLPKSTVSKAVSRLEYETGTKLLLRTTRSLTLTAAGRAFYDSCLGPIQTIEDAQKSLYGQDSILMGHLRITAPEDLGLFAVAPTIGRLSAQNPGLSFELHYTDQVVDLVKDGFDLAIRIGRLAESSFKVKKVGEVTMIAVASPEYLKKAEKIRQPKDLESHSCLSFSGTSLVDRWTLRTEGKSANLNLKTRISSNQMSSLLKLAISGAGVALVPKYLCQGDLQKNKLVHVLPDWKGNAFPVSIISPLSSSSSARLKVTIDALHQRLTGVLT